MTDEVLFVSATKTTKRLRLSKEARERQARLLEKGCCLGCERETVEGERVTRGLCHSCYNATRNAIRRERVTEEELIRDGYILTAANGGHPPVNAFTARLAGLPFAQSEK